MQSRMQARAHAHLVFERREVGLRALQLRPGAARHKVVRQRGLRLLWQLRLLARAERVEQPRQAVRHERQAGVISRAL